MRLGFIPTPRTPDGASVQPMAGDPPRERRITPDVARFAAEHDLRALEIDRWSWPAGVFPDRDEELALLDEHGLRIACVGLWGQDYLDPGAADEASAALDRALDYAREVDASVFVTGTEVPADWNDERAWDEGIAFYGDLCDRIAGRGLEPAFYFGHGDSPLVEGFDDIRRFADALPAARFKVDPANLLTGDVDPVALLHAFGDRVGHFHVKDGVVVDGDLVDQCPAGLGDVRWGAVVDMLYTGGYDGVLSVEPHGSYWGHAADDRTRRQGIRLAAEHVARRLQPADRPDGLA